MVNIGIHGLTLNIAKIGLIFCNICLPIDNNSIRSYTICS